MHMPCCSTPSTLQLKLIQHTTTADVGPNAVNRPLCGLQAVFTLQHDEAWTTFPVCVLLCCADNLTLQLILKISRLQSTAGDYPELFDVRKGIFFTLKG